MKNILFDIPYLWSGLIGWFIWGITFYIDGKTDSKLWKEAINDFRPDGSVNHNRGAILRLIGIGVSVIFIGWWGILPAFFVYWWAFDSWMGYVMVKDVTYIGGTSFLDKLQRKFKYAWGFKLGLSIGSITIYISKIVS